MKTKTGVAVEGVWQQDGTTPSSQGKSLANSKQFCWKSERAVSRTALRRCIAANGCGAVVDDAALMGEEDPKPLCPPRAGQHKGEHWWGKEQDREMGRSGRSLLMWHKCLCDLELSWRWLGARGGHIRTSMMHTCLIYEKSSALWSPPSPQDGIGLMMCICWYAARCNPQPSSEGVLCVRGMIWDQSPFYSGVFSNLFTVINKVKSRKLNSSVSDVSLLYFIVCNRGCFKRACELQVCDQESALP